jgi:hypothetical protein
MLWDANSFSILFNVKPVAGVATNPPIVFLIDAAGSSLMDQPPACPKQKRLPLLTAANDLTDRSERFEPTDLMAPIPEAHLCLNSRLGIET